MIRVICVFYSWLIKYRLICCANVTLLFCHQMRLLIAVKFLEEILALTNRPNLQAFIVVYYHYIISIKKWKWWYFRTPWPQGSLLYHTWGQRYRKSVQQCVKRKWRCFFKRLWGILLTRIITTIHLYPSTPIKDHMEATRVDAISFPSTPVMG